MPPVSPPAERTAAAAQGEDQRVMTGWWRSAAQQVAAEGRHLVDAARRLDEHVVLVRSLFELALDELLARGLELARRGALRTGGGAGRGCGRRRRRARTRRGRRRRRAARRRGRPDRRDAGG